MIPASLKRALSWIALATLPLGAQVPPLPDATFFSQPPRSLMRLCGDEAVRLAPRDALLLAAYGEVLLAAGDRVRAEEVFAMATQRRPDDYRTLRLIGRAWLSQGYSREGLATYTLLLSADGGYVSRKNRLCNAAVDLVSFGETRVAAEYMEQSYRLDKGDANNFLEFGRAALLRGERELAATYFARAAKADPKEADTWLDIADAYASLWTRTAKRTP